MNDHVSRRITRRRLVSLAVLATAGGAAAGLLQACSPAAAPTATTAPVALTKAPEATKAAPAATKAPEATKAAPAATKAPEATKAPASEVKKGGTLRVGVGGKTSYDHFCTLKRATHGEEIWMRRIPAAKLVAYNEDYTQWVPDLAESWKLEGRNLTFNLRKGVKWHDGQPFTAHDVEFTFAMMVLPEIGNFGVEFMNFVEGYKQAYEDKNLTISKSYKAPGITVVDDYTIQFKLSDNWAIDTVLLGLAQSSLPIPKHILGDYMESREKAAKVAESEWALRKYVGLGPFKVVEYVPDQRIVYEAYENYHFGRPLLDRVVYTPFADDQTQVAALRAGELDLGMPPASELKSLKAEKQLRIHSSVTPGTSSIGLNCRPSFPTGDKRVRQAMMYGLDRQAYAQTFAGADAADSMYPLAGYGGVPADIKKYPYDPEKAKALLKEAKWDPSYEFKFELEAIPADASSFEFMFDQYSKIGMKCGFKAVGQGKGTWYAKDGFTSDAIVSFWGGGPHPNAIRSTWQCDDPPQRSGWCDKDLSALWNRVDYLSGAELAKAWAEVQKIMAENVPHVYLAPGLRSWAINTRVQGKLEPSLVYWQGNHWQLEKLWIKE